VRAFLGFSPNFQWHLAAAKLLMGSQKVCEKKWWHWSPLSSCKIWWKSNDACRRERTKCYFLFLFLRASNRYRLDVRPSVRLSVRPSVTRWYCIKTAERIVMISSPHDSPFILVLCVPRSSRNSDGVTPYGGVKYRWGIKICAIFYQ